MPQLRASIRAAQAALAIILGGAGAAQAAFVTTANPPDLFPVGSVFAGVPPMCVVGGPLNGVCTSNSKQLTLSSTVSFGGGNEYVVLNGKLTGDTTNPTGSFTLTGPEGLTLIGRSNPYQQGTFAIDVTYADFTGTYFGQTLELTLDPAGPNNGQISVTETGGSGLNGEKHGYLIDTTLNISTVISVDGGLPTPVGTVHTTVEVPEPAVLSLLGLPLFALTWIRRRG